MRKWKQWRKWKKRGCFVFEPFGNFFWAAIPLAERAGEDPETFFQKNAREEMEETTKSAGVVNL